MKAINLEGFKLRKSVSSRDILIERLTNLGVDINNCRQRPFAINTADLHTIVDALELAKSEGVKIDNLPRPNIKHHNPRFQPSYNAPCFHRVDAHNMLAVVFKDYLDTGLIGLIAPVDATSILLAFNNRY